MSIANPDGSSLVAAAQWVEGMVQGPAATAIAVVAIAATGFSMMSGRLQVRRGFAVILGSFILFGAPSIARGIIGSVAMSFPVQAVEPSLAEKSRPPPFVPPTPPPKQAVVDDPYAGASIIR